MGVKERLIAYIEYKGLAIRTFEKSLGFSNGFVKNLSKSTQPDKLEKISNLYPDLNITWLIIGKGNMLISEQPAPEEIPAFLARMREEEMCSHQSQMEQISEMKEIMNDLREQVELLKKTSVQPESNAECADVS